MFFDIIFSGFGGQGALFAGQLLAYAAMDEGHHITWIPSYGPEMRGGTAHCVVIISDEEIGSPLVRTPNTVIALNNPSVEKYEPLMAQHGHLIYNASLTSHVVTRRNIHAIPIPGSEAAAELGHAKLLNMVMLGALLDRVPVLTLDALDRALEGHLPARRRDLLEANKLALRKGIELSQAVLIPA